MSETLTNALQEYFEGLTESLTNLTDTINKLPSERLRRVLGNGLELVTNETSAMAMEIAVEGIQEGSIAEAYVEQAYIDIVNPPLEEDMGELTLEEFLDEVNQILEEEDDGDE